MQNIIWGMGGLALAIAVALAGCDSNNDGSTDAAEMMVDPSDTGDGDAATGDGDAAPPPNPTPDSAPGTGQGRDAATVDDQDAGTDQLDAGVEDEWMFAFGDAGAGSVGMTCGTRGTPPCGEGLYCRYPMASQCGANDRGGSCVQLLSSSTLCPAVREPVCGCDGVTYGNACEATRANVSVAAEGACELGSGETCGGIAGLVCGEGEFCNYEPASGGMGCAQIADAAGVCQSRPDACTRDYMPVCGCNRHSYSNRCEAHRAGVSAMRSGLCTDQDCLHIGGRVAFGTGPAPMCESGETSAGPVRLASGAVPIEGALCCLPGKR